MVLIAVAIFMIFVDQGIKFLIVTTFSVGDTTGLIPGIISLTRMQNTGVAFSIGEGINAWIFAGISIAVSVCLIVLIATRIIKQTGQRFALTFVIAGAVSNALDRIVSGYVVDMFKLEFINFGIFNVADICIVIGIIVFAILWIKGDVKTASAAKKATGGSKRARKGDDHARQQAQEESFGRNFNLKVDNIDISDDMEMSGEDAQDDSEYSLNDILREFGDHPDDY